MYLTVFSYLTRRRMTYFLEPETWGWIILHDFKLLRCDKTGGPFLHQSLRENDVKCPANIPQQMAALWDAAMHRRLKDSEMQAYLNQLGEKTWPSPQYATSLN